MTLAEAEEIFAYWAENPPAHLMLQVIARAFGWKPADRTRPSPADLAAMVPLGLAVAVRSDLGMPPPVFDIDALRARNHARLANSGKRL
jgi:hypothetical protein